MRLIEGRQRARIVHFHAENKEIAEIYWKLIRCEEWDVCNLKNLIHSTNKECAQQVTKLDVAFALTL